MSPPKGRHKPYPCHPDAVGLSPERCQILHLGSLRSPRFRMTSGRAAV